jgi:hypothetical protein
LKASGIVKLPRYVVRLDGTVLTVTKDNTIKINTVDVMRADEDFVYISGGLPLDQKVVMSAMSAPYDGMPVRFTDDKPSTPLNSENEKSNEVSL